ncbi:NAD-dependent aldehyde dehydrogenase [Desulfosarcina variabilis str. Montpellier]|uniref:aldehyde dehydrogenase n=1 Tax=Desulfosarcina variabilis TaxID=2300 RepID=UPI003AFB1851
MPNHSRMKAIVQKQRDFFNQGQTRSTVYRIDQLKKLLAAVKVSEDAILAALKADLNKPVFEAYSTEVMQITTELKYTIRHLKKWTREKKVPTPLELQPARSRIHTHPYGVVLNIAPWNYPVQICLIPLIAILAAGNCAVVKPSELAPQTSRLVATLISGLFPPEYCTVVEGGVEETQALLAQRWNYIAFTGSPAIGRIVARAAAENLTPTLLELGGKSPCIVHDDTNIQVAARRIAWGKFLNAGQTCTAPDFVVAQSRIAGRLVDEIGRCINAFYDADALKSPDYGRIINHRHFDRLVSLMELDKIVYGGHADRDQRYIEPTIIYKADWDDEIMQDEIFGPLLPVLEYEKLDTVMDRLLDRERPLALYLFTENRALQRKIVGSLNFGGGAINATLLQNGNKWLPFGGVGTSGMGRYHGKSGFDTFSTTKSMVSKPTCIDPSLPYPPYKGKVKLLKRLS